MDSAGWFAVPPGRDRSDPQQRGRRHAIRPAWRPPLRPGNDAARTSGRTATRGVGGRRHRRDRTDDEGALVFGTEVAAPIPSRFRDAALEMRCELTGDDGSSWTISATLARDLQAAIMRPQQSVFGSDAHPDMHTTAAAMMHSIARHRSLIAGVLSLDRYVILTFSSE